MFWTRRGPMHDQVEHSLELDCACCVEQNVGEAAGAVGEECLVDFVDVSDEEDGGDGHAVADPLTGRSGELEISHLPDRQEDAAEDDQGKEAVAGEVADFADHVMDVGPARVDGRAEYRVAGGV